MILIILIIIIVFYILNNYLLFYDEDDTNENFVINKDLDIHITVARYNESLKWTLDYPFNQFTYTVYNKSNNENFEKKYVTKIVSLPNVGKCDHTYLYHIIKNYDNLSAINVFLPGSIDLKYKKRIASKLLREIQETSNATFISLNEYDIKNLYYDFKMNKYQTKYKVNRILNSESKIKKSEIRPYGKWFENKFGDIKINCVIYYGIFSIHKEDIIQHPKSRYEMLIKDLSDHPNPEAGHYFERSWCAVFHPLKETYIIKYNKI